MALRQNLLNFRCGTSGILKDESVWRKVVERITSSLGGDDISENDNQFQSGRLTLLLSSKLRSHATIRSDLASDKSTLLVDLTFPSEGGLDQQALDTLEQDLGELLKCSRFNRMTFPIVSHGVDKVSDGSYLRLADGRLCQYDFTDLVFEQDSDYQNIKIFTSGQYGNVLVLDNDVNLAESDLTYTQAITGHGHEAYEGKRVLVLGGGDGGILNQLLKQAPGYVEMIDIDQVVIDAAIKHLRGICGSSMDSLEGPNYKVRVEDCIPAMKEHIANGVQFDVVINDMTAIPISNTPVDSFWDFMREILDLSFRVLKPCGVYYTQGNSVCAQSALTMYESELAKLSPAVDFLTNSVCVPSYAELWMFYEIWRKDHAAQRQTNRLKPLSS